MYPRTVLLVLWVPWALAGPARAEHSDPGYAVWPAEEVALPTNARVMALSVNGLAPEVTELARRTPRLVGGGEVVPLRIVDEFRGHDWGSYGTSGFVLEPARPLRPLTRYELCEDQAGGQLCLGGWTTARGADRRPPVWTGPPHPYPTQREYYQYGFELPVRDDGPLLIAVTATRPGQKQRVLFGLNDRFAPQGCVSLILDQPVGTRRRFLITFTAYDVPGHRRAQPISFPVLVQDQDNIELCLPKPPREPDTPQQKGGSDI